MVDVKGRRMADTQKDKRILCVGLCCLDIVSVLQSFPKEDTDQRSLDYYWQKGGNAANTSSVLGMLGANVEFFGTFVNGQEYEFLKTDLGSYNIKVDNCVVYDPGIYKSPTAIVLINKENGSRTIMAALNELVEVCLDDFNNKIELSNYKWIHFEGRPNIPEMLKMMEKVAHYNSKLPDTQRIKVSLELEKPKRIELESLLNLVDVVFVSKEYAQEHGCNSKEQAVEKYLHICNERSTIICAWGEDGAAGSNTRDSIVTSSIFPPEKMVDTIGAGDTFNAATIHALTQGQGLKESVTFGCKVAGAKCGMAGYRGLNKFNSLPHNSPL